MHFKKLAITDIRKETGDCVSIAFDIPASLKETFHFIQGQNITVKTIIDGEEIRRSYSICSSPLDNELRIAVKKVDGGKFSQYANHQLQKGDTLDLLPPNGKFYTVLDAAVKKNYIAFAAGSGITPIISIIKTTLATEPASRFTLVYGNRNRASIMFKEELEALKNRYIDRFVLHHVLSREKTDADINHGHIDAAKCAELSKSIIDITTASEIFLCGPAAMIFALKDWLQEKGAAQKHIHFELFASPKAEAESYKPTKAENNSVVHSSKITIRLDGIAFDFNLPFEGETILDAALKQGADLPFACKGGVCSTCRAKLTEGKVTMETNYALEPEELQAGYILTCQSHPVTEKVTIDFDAK